MNRHALIPGTGWDCPPEYFSYEEHDPALYERAQRALFERKVGDDCEGVSGHMGPAETALWQFLAASLKSIPETTTAAEIAGFALRDLLRNWRNEIMDRLDRDEIESLADEYAADREGW